MSGAPCRCAGISGGWVQQVTAVSLARTERVRAYEATSHSAQPASGRARCSTVRPVPRQVCLRVPQDGASHVRPVIEMPQDRFGKGARVAGFEYERRVIGELRQGAEIAHHHRDAGCDRQDTNAALACLGIWQDHEGGPGEQLVDLFSGMYLGISEMR